MTARTTRCATSPVDSANVGLGFLKRKPSKLTMASVFGCSTDYMMLRSAERQSCFAKLVTPGNGFMNPSPGLRGNSGHFHCGLCCAISMIQESRNRKTFATKIFMGAAFKPSKCPYSEVIDPSSLLASLLTSPLSGSWSRDV